MTRRPAPLPGAALKVSRRFVSAWRSARLAVTPRGAAAAGPFVFGARGCACGEAALRDRDGDGAGKFHVRL